MRRCCSPRPAENGPQVLGRGADHAGPYGPADRSSHLHATGRAGSQRRELAGLKTVRPSPADRADIGRIPAEPPPSALREVDRAAGRAKELWNDKRELHFEVDDGSGRVIVQVRDLAGHVIRTIPASEALDVLSGRPL